MFYGNFNFTHFLRLHGAKLNVLGIVHCGSSFIQFCPMANYPNNQYNLQVLLQPADFYGVSPPPPLILYFKQTQVW
jgi:hypothetical protein